MKKLTLYIRTFFLGLGILSGATLWAQGDPSEAILEESKKVFESLSDFSASYSYELKNEAMKANKVSKKGTFKFKEGMYFLDLGNQAIYCDLENQWIHLKEDEEVTIVAYDPEEAVNIESVYKVYESNAKSTYQGSETLNGKKTHKILLTSLDKGLEYNQVTLWVNDRTKLLDKAILVDRNQTEEVITFLDMKTNLGFSTNDFQFNAAKHPGVEVYDER